MDFPFQRGDQPFVFRGEGVRILLKYVDDPIDSTHSLEDLLENSFRFEVCIFEWAVNFAEMIDG